MRVLFVSSEVYPLAKSGGLADVSAALPAAMAELGVDMRLLLPGYPSALEAAINKSVVIEINDFMGCGVTRLIIARTPDTGLPVWLLDCPRLFQRRGLYWDKFGADWPDNWLRYCVLNHAAVRLACGEWAPGWRADVVHANDWHAGLVAPLIAAVQGKKPGVIFTIHNLAYQGLFPAHIFPQLGFPANGLLPESLEFHGKVCFLKAGILYSDQVTTVSPTYAREMLTPEYGCGLDGLLQRRSKNIAGILNGVDYDIWDSANDPNLAGAYTEANLAGKARCKATLRAELGLAASDAPLVVFVSRIIEQKMADIVLQSLPAMLERGVEFALLGDGDPVLEEQFQIAGRRHPGQVAIKIGYTEPLGHRFLAGADILLHPARFEPCGLTQLYAMRYGALPIARRVGGLADTIVDADLDSIHSGAATGFLFGEVAPDALVAALDRALALYAQPGLWRRMQRRAMTRDFGWGRPARRYLELYSRIAPQAAAPRVPDQNSAAALIQRV